MKSLFHEGGKNIIITDKEQDVKLLEIFGESITKRNWKKLTTIADFLEMTEIQTGNFIIHPQILETTGNLEYLRRKTLHKISRGNMESMENTIETLIALGYSHSEYSGELGTYRREGSIVTLTHAQSGNTIHIEWFDTEIDSIIEIDGAGNRSYRDFIWIKNEKIEENQFERKVGKINEELLFQMISYGRGFGGGNRPQRENQEATSQNRVDTPETFVTFGHESKRNVSGKLDSEINSEGQETEGFSPRMTETKKGPLNQPTIFLIGCDFHGDLETLRKHANIHFTDFHREDSISLDISIPDIPHIDALKHYIEENSSKANICFYTKNEKSVQDFLEFHALSGCQIIPTPKSGLESCEIPKIHLHLSRNNEKQKNGESEGATLSEGRGKQFSDERQQSESEFVDPSGAFGTFQSGKVRDIHESKENVSKKIGAEADSSTSLGMTNNQQLTIILTDDILGNIFVRTRTKKSLAKNLDLLLHVNPGDYVVHREHGIARFHAVVDKTLGDIRREYLELHYAGGDKIFVPLTEIYRVSKYVGELEPQLTSLTGKEWERTLEKTDEELEKIATELIEIASKRTLSRGITFKSLPTEEEQFRSRFPYDYTPDQLEAIHEIFRDMESEYPMDRLLSGDVGFGKTEVAMNAMYKAVLSGYQVAVISPLLVLADEHYETFMERFTEYGIHVECLTRMTSTSEEKRILDGMKNGNVDIVVGTHKLLSENIRWKKLGLLVIDEEHKFGVSHKETIKKMRANIDILSLSATPIPRSLNLALSGLKKVSLLGTAPKKKKPIETIVSTWTETTIAHAIQYELERGGQIIIVHNRIRGMEQMEKEIESIIQDFSKNIPWTKGKIQNNGGEQKNGETEGWKLSESDENQKIDEQSERVFSPLGTFGTFSHESTELDSGTSQEGQKSRYTGLLHSTRNDDTNDQPKIIITHGQMHGDVIEERIHAFKKGEYNILLTTTIIENGVNFLKANTIIIIDPEDFGLAQLHQLRGRVGRKGEQGYCYLMYRKPELAAIEKERIITIANNTHLGAGFEIAMRDMEIRGAGDVLGFKQAGKSKDIGLTLYFRMLEEKIAEIKDEKQKKKPVKIELELSYALDDSLFLSESDKLNFFREIENIETLEELDAMEEEMMEKIGTMNDKIGDNSDTGKEFMSHHSSLITHVTNLFLLLRARLTFSEYGLESLKKVGQNYIFDFYDGTKVEKIRAFLDRFDAKNRMTLLSVKKIRTEVRYWKTVQEFLEELVGC